MAEENFREAFSLFPACQKLLPHLYPKIQGFEGVFERRLYSLFTKRVSTKHLAPYIHKNGILATLEKTSLTYMNKKGLLNTLF